MADTFENEAQQREAQMNAAVQESVADTKAQHEALDAQADAEVQKELAENPPAKTEDGTDAEFEQWFASASEEAAANVEEATGKTPDQYSNHLGAVSDADLGLDGKDTAPTSAEKTTASADSANEDAEIVPVNGHFNVVSIGAEYFNRLIAVLMDRRNAYQNEFRKTQEAGYEQAGNVCNELLQVIMPSALRFTDTAGNPSVALTVQDEDMNNLLVILLAATYDPNVEDEDFASQLRGYGA